MTTGRGKQIGARRQAVPASRRARRRAPAGDEMAQLRRERDGALAQRKATAEAVAETGLEMWDRNVAPDDEGACTGRSAGLSPFRM